LDPQVVRALLEEEFEGGPAETQDEPTPEIDRLAARPGFLDESTGRSYTIQMEQNRLEIIRLMNFVENEERELYF